MARAQHLGKGYGSRYGRRLRLKTDTINELRRKSTKCPYCNYDGVSRIAVGIWECSKCTSKFSGKAYTFSRKLITAPKEAMLEEQAEAIKEEKAVEKEEEEVEEKGQKVPDVLKEPEAPREEAE